MTTSATKFKEGDWVRCIAAGSSVSYKNIVGKAFRVGQDNALENRYDECSNVWRIPEDGMYDHCFEHVKLEVGQRWKLGPEAQSEDAVGAIWEVVSNPKDGKVKLELLHKGFDEYVFKVGEVCTTLESTVLGREGYYLLNGPGHQPEPKLQYNYKRSECPYCTLSKHNIAGFILMPGHSKPLECLECDPNA